MGNLKGYGAQQLGALPLHGFELDLRRSTAVVLRVAALVAEGLRAGSTLR